MNVKPIFLFVFLIFEAILCSSAFVYASELGLYSNWTNVLGAEILCVVALLLFYWSYPARNSGMSNAMAVGVVLPWICGIFLYKLLLL